MRKVPVQSQREQGAGPKQAAAPGRATSSPPRDLSLLTRCLCEIWDSGTSYLAAGRQSYTARDSYTLVTVHWESANGEMPLLCLRHASDGKGGVKNVHLRGVRKKNMGNKNIPWSAVQFIQLSSCPSVGASPFVVICDTEVLEQIVFWTAQLLCCLNLALVIGKMLVGQMK